jgi:hypothetical protein
VIDAIQTFVPHLKFWVNEVLISMVFIYLISGIVSNLRLGIGRRWVLVPSLIFFYLLCVGCAVGFGLVSHTGNSIYHQMKSPYEPAQVTKDWGKDMSIEKRNKYSLDIARNAFLNGGCFRDYVDLNGNLRAYIPSEDDRKYRTSFLSSLDQLDQAVTLYFWAGIGWLLIPLLGVGIGFTNLGQRIGRTLAKRYPQTKAIY